MKITFKDGIIIEVSEIEEGRNKKEVIAEAKRIHKNFVKDAKVKRNFYTNTAFSLPKIKEAIAAQNWRSLNKELDLLSRDIDTDLSRNENYTERYSKDQLKKVIKDYQDVINELRRINNEDVSAAYIVKSDEIEEKINHLKNHWNINDSKSVNDVPPYYDPSVTVGESGTRYSASRIEKADRYNDITILNAEFDGIIEDLEEYIQDTTSYDDPENILHKFRKDELRQITSKYYELANIYKKHDLNDQADAIKNLTDTLYYRWHLGA